MALALNFRIPVFERQILDPSLKIGRSSPTNVYFGMIQKQFRTEEEIPPPLHSPQLVFRSGASQLILGLVMYCEIAFYLLVASHFADK